MEPIDLFNLIFIAVNITLFLDLIMRHRNIDKKEKEINNKINTQMSISSKNILKRSELEDKLETEKLNYIHLETRYYRDLGAEKLKRALKK